MENLEGKTWRDEDEMIEELEDLGYDIIDITNDYILLMDIDDRMSEFPTEYVLRLERTESKIKII